MPSRIQLENRARVVGIDPALYVNDSKLEQRIIYNENKAATVTGTLANTTLTSDATNNANADTITIGAAIYTYVTTLTEVAATNTITDGNGVNVSDGDILTINTISYRFKTTIAKPYDINIGANADASLTNLVSAIMLTGTIGTDYGTGTLVNPDVSAAAVAAHATTLTAKVVGTFANRFVLSTSAASLTLGAATFSGGVAPVANQILIGVSASTSLDNTKSAINGTAGGGTTYSSGTGAHALVTAGTKTATTLVVSAIKAASAISIASTTTAAHLSWTGATIGSNVQAIVAAPTASLSGETGGAAV